MNMWDERYSGEQFAYGTEPNEFLVESARYLPAGGEVLSLAEGEGRNGVFLARSGFRVTAMDGSRVGLEKARALAAREGVDIETVHADLAEFEMGEARWDAIISIWVHMPIALRGDVYRRCVRALKPGGVLILEAYTPDQLRYGTGGPRDVAYLATIEDLRADLCGLTFPVAREAVITVHEGEFHGGPSAVAQIVARKPDAPAGR